MTTQVGVVVLAHNEARRIERCLASIVADAPHARVDVVVNGSTDATAAIASRFAERHPRVRVHDWPEGGKSRSWNRFVHDTLVEVPDVLLFVDGDAEVVPGSLPAMVAAIDADAHLLCVGAMPGNGRRRAHYRAELREEHGIFGDLYALRGSFVRRLRAARVRLPDDLIGDDGLVGALAKIDLGTLEAWDDRRVLPIDAASFLCEPVTLTRPSSWRLQYRRMINYSMRHFQNAIVTDILRREGAGGLPRRLASLYPEWLPRFTPRSGIDRHFDRLALERMARAAAEETSDVVQCRESETGAALPPTTNG